MATWTAAGSIATSTGHASASHARASPQTAPYVTSKRGPKYVGWTFCPHCFFPKVGVAYHGTLSTGQKVFELATHSPGAGLRRPGKPICNGSNGRLESMADGSWRPLK
jgi:hypothetical protein